MQPNFVVFLTDDQRVDLVSPGMTQLAAQGFDFRNAFSTTPICGPSRVSLLTGQLASRHGVTTNYGTAEAFGARPHLGTALQATGYTTAYVGKYLNDYHLIAPAIPTGWTHFCAYVTPPFGAHLTYTLNEQGTFVDYTDRYLTDVLRDRALTLLWDMPQPFCLFIAMGAPHSPYTPAPHHAGAYATAPWSPRPSHFEPDMSGKPQWLRDFQAAHALNQAQLTTEVIARRHAQQEMLLAVDDALAVVSTALLNRGIAQTTATFYLSDNGMLEHEHWWHQKCLFYEECIRVPFLVRYSGWGGTALKPQRMVTVMDVAPTIAAMAGATLPGPVDGADLRTIFVNPAAWRTSIKLEYWPHAGFPLTAIPGYAGAREAGWSYAQHTTGEDELYDLAADPYQLTNRAGDLAYTATRARLRTAAGL